MSNPKPKMSNTLINSGLTSIEWCLTGIDFERYVLVMYKNVSMHHSTIAYSTIMQPQKVVNAYYGMAAAL